MDGAQLFGETIKALARMSDATKKVRIEADLFGQRAVMMLQPLFRLTEAQTDAIQKLADTFDGTAAVAIGEAQASLNLLGETLMQRLVMPIMGEVAPVIEYFADKIAQVVNFFADLNDAMGGMLGKELALIIGVLGGVLLTVIIQIGIVATALAALLWPLMKLFEMIGDFLQSIGLPDLLKKLGIDVNLPHPSADDPVAADTKRIADATEAMEGHLRGNKGERSRFAQTSMQIEYALQQQVLGGIG